LKLTYASLGAFTKYPCPALFNERDKKKRSQKKFGFFQSEENIFNEIAEDLQLIKTHQNSWSRHPLAFLVEAADDICYSIIDLEDGCSLGLVSYNDAKQLFEGVITRSKSKLGKLDQLRTLPEKIGFLRALAIGDLMQECTGLFLDHENEILSGKFDTALADECTSRNALKEIIKISVEKIYQARSVVEIEASGHEVLPGLLHEFTIAGSSLVNKIPSRKYENLQKLFPEDIANAIISSPDDNYNMLRNVIDFVSGMTDRHALSLFRKIKGISV
jgi:dGTPase